MHPLSGTAAAAGAVAMDVAVVNANIRPISSLTTPADAILIRGERIVELGRTNDWLLNLPAGVRVLDAAGATVLPGFIDSHVHLENGDNYDHSMDGAASSDEILDRLKVALSREGFNAPLLCHGLGPCALPTLRELDQLESNRPVLIGIGAGAMVVNTAAMERSRARHGTEFVDRQVPSAGRGPTGEFRGRAVKDFVRSVLGYDEDYVEQALLRGAAQLTQAGVTSIHHIVRDALPVRVWQSLRRRGQMPVRVGLLMRGYESKIPLAGLASSGIQQGFGDPWLRMQGVKISVDGHFPGGGAAFTQPYSDEPDNSGSLRVTQEDLDYFVAGAHDAGLRICVHANGDRAVDMALAAFTSALRARPRPDHRHRLEHVGNIYLRDDQIAAMRALGLVAVPNPPFLLARAEHVGRRLGEHRAAKPMRIRDLIESHIPVVAASDFPGLFPPDPLLAIQALVTREDAAGISVAASQAISVQQAIELYTSRAAWAAFEEADKGTIEIGKLADLSVLSADPYALAPRDIGSIRIKATMIGGSFVSGSLDETHR